jgi:NADPH-dependent 2,4-dienoyl-CoA reductase/sulfur reductase-like enzyme
LARFSAELLCSDPGKLVQGAGYAWNLRGVPWRTGSWITRASGNDNLETVTVTDGKHTTELEAELLAVGYHLVPSTELAQLMGCEMVRGFVRVDSLQQTSVEGVFCAGEATGIGGADKALVEGRIAALAASGNTAGAAKLTRSRNRHLEFARRLEAAFSLRDELRTLADKDTIVCRCEDVSHGELESCRSWREAKLHTRCGMGPCQGRVCGSAAAFLYGWETPRPRPPLFPVEISSLAGMNSNAD